MDDGKQPGLADYADRAISECVATVSHELQGSRLFLMGHSLGGTLAAIFCALEQESVRGLVLLGAPLCFAPGSSQFRDGVKLGGMNEFHAAAKQPDSKVVAF